MGTPAAGLIFMDRRRLAAGSGRRGRCAGGACARRTSAAGAGCCPVGGADQAGEQVGNLVAGQGDQPGWRALGVLGHGGDGEEGKGGLAKMAHRYQEAPRWTLVLVQPGQALCGLEVLLCAPADPCYPHQGGQRHVVRGVAAIEGQLAGVPVAADQQPAVARGGPPRR